jgi:hypothetical protein
MEMLSSTRLEGSNLFDMMNEARDIVGSGAVGGREQQIWTLKEVN